jgi:tyrosine-protein kinase Etk/Wzc
MMSHNDEAPRAVPLIVPSGAPAPRRADGGPNGVELARVLLEGRWVLAGCALVALAVAGAYLLVATPRFRAEALLRIEERRETGATPDPITGDLERPPVRTEIEMLRSRTLLAAAAERAGLDVVASPRTVPFLSRALARLHRGAAPRPAPLGLSRFAWGGERIVLGSLEVPEALLDAPLVLTADEDGGFRLATPGGATLVDGAVGRRSDGADPEGRPVRVLVSELVARPGTEFEVRKLRLAEVVAGLQLMLAVEERGRDTGVVALRLEGADRGRVARTLDALVELYLRENGERTTERVERTLGVLDERLPALKGNVARAESALEAWKVRNGTVDVGAETRALLERSVGVERRIADLEARRAELSSRRWTEKHPGLGELNDQIEALQIQQRLIEQKLRGLPAAELAAARLTRDVQVATALYLQVLERAQQYRIAAARTSGSAALVDPPSASLRPVAPRAPPVLGLALLVGLSVGAVLAIVRSRLGGAEDAIEVEFATGLPVLGGVPHSSTESSLARVIRRRLTGHRAAALHAVNPGDVAVEDLRALRTNLAVALRGARSNVVAIGGPSPGVGKSFVCVNLALLLASPRRKVLLVDADLRRGRIHREFGLERTPGLAEVLSGTAALEAAIRPSGTEGLDLLAAGELPDDPTSLLEGPRFQELLAEAGKRYDVVLVDTAAILAVTDPALVARHAGLSLLVLRAGEHPVEEIALAVRRLQQSGARVDGAILNDLRPARHRYRYEYRARARA